MFKLKTLALCAALAAAALSTSAQAQQINVPNTADAGTSAKVDRLRAFGNSESSTWDNSVNTNCSDINIGSNTNGNTTANPFANPWASNIPDPNAPGWAAPPNAAIQQDPNQVTVVTGNITNVCFTR